MKQGLEAFRGTTMFDRIRLMEIVVEKVKAYLNLIPYDMESERDRTISGMELRKALSALEEQE